MLKFHSRPRRKNPEAAIQRAVVEHLRLTAPAGVLWLAIKNEGRRSEALGLEYKRQGMRPGASDLFICAPWCRPVFLELKTSSGKQSAEQQQFAADAQAAGCDYEIAHGIDQALAVLRLYGFIPGGNRRAA